MSQGMQTIERSLKLIPSGTAAAIRYRTAQLSRSSRLTKPARAQWTRASRRARPALNYPRLTTRPSQWRPEWCWEMNCTWEADNEADTHSDSDSWGSHRDLWRSASVRTDFCRYQTLSATQRKERAAARS